MYSQGQTIGKPNKIKVLETKIHNGLRGVAWLCLHNGLRGVAWLCLHNGLRGVAWLCLTLTYIKITSLRHYNYI
jgi:hypothetical protein